MAEAFIVATARTAGGRKGGRLAGWHPADLAAQVLDSLVARSGADAALPFGEGFHGVRGDALYDYGGGPRAADFQEGTSWIRR